MEILGYIVSKSKIKDLLPCIKIVNSYELIEDKTKPVLIIGLEEARKITSSFSILEKKINNRLFWTFGKREKRIDFEKDIENFQNYIIKQIIKKFTYYYINVLTIKQEKIKKIIKIINNQDDKKFFFDEKMIYMHYQNNIFGFSLEISEYIGLKREKIIKLIKKNKNNKIGKTNIIFNSKIKELIANKRYMAVYFATIEDEN